MFLASLESMLLETLQAYLVLIRQKPFIISLLQSFIALFITLSVYQWVSTLQELALQLERIGQ